MKTILSMTTIPGRVATLKPTLDSLFAQTANFDELRLHLTPNCGGLDVQVTGRALDRFKVVPSFDYGPVTKLACVNDRTLDGNTLIITVDDDIEYKPKWLGTILEAATRWSSDAIGFSGWNVGGFLEGTGSYQFASPPCFCDVMEGWAGAAYRKRFFDDVDMMNYPPAFKFVDDVWISSVLNKRGVRRRLIAFPQAQPVHPDAPGLHKRLDFVELNRNAVRNGFTL